MFCTDKTRSSNLLNHYILSPLRTLGPSEQLCSFAYGVNNYNIYLLYILGRVFLKPFNRLNILLVVLVKFP